MKQYTDYTVVIVGGLKISREFVHLKLSKLLSAGYVPYSDPFTLDTYIYQSFVLPNTQEQLYND